MKALNSALRLRRFEVDEMARKIADLTCLVREFLDIAATLDREIKAEERETGIKDPTHWAYSTFARSARQRRENLIHSIEGLQALLEAAQREYQAARAELPEHQNDNFAPDGTEKTNAAVETSLPRGGQPGMSPFLDRLLTTKEGIVVAGAAHPRARPR